MGCRNEASDGGSHNLEAQAMQLDRQVESVGAQDFELELVACGSWPRAVWKLRAFSSNGNDSNTPKASSLMVEPVMPETGARLGGGTVSCCNMLVTDAQRRRSVKPEPRTRPSAPAVGVPKRRSIKPEPRARTDHSDRPEVIALYADSLEAEFGNLLVRVPEDVWTSYDSDADDVLIVRQDTIAPQFPHPRDFLSAHEYSELLRLGDQYLLKAGSSSCCSE
eukprot:TRINITY_DN64591_c0_g1_i1.p1 TRINITY_DN64591_c0_g1~~TRINITY_DN64591_c0_g1_i1.p1  ORF type:complete len:245 (+),score=25.44 TRINITY_DN64591_c0_g1_i1:74-736(+)